MSKVFLSLQIDPGLKKTIQSYCSKNKIELGSFVEKVLIEFLEDEIDSQSVLERKNESCISLNKLCEKI